MHRKKLPPPHKFRTDHFYAPRGDIYFKDLNRRVSIRLSIEDFMRLKKIAHKQGVRIAPFIRKLLRAYLEKLPYSV